MEMLVTIVIAGILAAIVAMFGNPIRGAIEGQRRAELADIADTAYRRMARDLRRAVPNSIRKDGTRLEMILSSDGGRYLDVGDGLAGNVLSFTDSTKTSFDVLGAPVGIAAGDYIVVGNWGNGTADAYCAGTTCNNRAMVAAPGATVTLEANPYPALGAEYASSGGRFQIVSNAEQAVAYDCSGGRLTRYWKYGFSHNYTGGKSALLATDIECAFDYVQFDVDLWGLVYIKIGMVSTDLPGEKIELVYQIHVDNTP